jgi:hypothetical protein
MDGVLYELLTDVTAILVEGQKGSALKKEPYDRGMKLHPLKLFRFNLI